MLKSNAPMSAIFSAATFIVIVSPTEGSSVISGVIFIVVAEKEGVLIIRHEKMIRKNENGLFNAFFLTQSRSELVFLRILILQVIKCLANTDTVRADALIPGLMTFGRALEELMKSRKTHICLPALHDYSKTIPLCTTSRRFSQCH